MCGTGCSSDKALKRHYKEQHQMTFNKNCTPPPTSPQPVSKTKKPKKATEELVPESEQISTNHIEF